MAPPGSAGLIFATPSYVAATGWSPEEFLGHNALEFIHPEDAELSREMLGRRARRDGASAFTYRFRTKDGRWLWVDSIVTLARGAPGESDGLVITSRDVTERKRDEAELQETPIVTLTRAEGITDQGAWVFRNMLTNSAQADAIADYAMNVKGYKRFALLYPNIPYGVELADTFWDEVISRGGAIRGAERYSHDQTTFTQEAKKLVGRYYLEDRLDYIEGVREINASNQDAFRRRKAIDKLKSGLDPVVDFDELLDVYPRIATQPQ